MRFLILSILLVSLVNRSSSQCAIPEIISPDGGELLMSGEEFDIEFDYGPIDFDFNDHVFFYYSLNFGDTWIFVDTIFIDSLEIEVNPIVNYSWIVPSIETSECIIIISRYEEMCWDESDDVFTISSPLFIRGVNILESNDLRIYPNPVKRGSDIQLESKNLKELNAKLINAQGQEVGNYLLIGGDMKIPTNNIRAGQYYLMIEHEEKILIESIFIN